MDKRAENKKQEQQRKDDRKDGLFFPIAFFIASLLCVLLGIPFLGGIKATFLQRYFVWVSVVFCALLCVFFVFAVLVWLWRKETLVKLFFSVYLLLVFCLVISFILQKSGFFAVIDSVESLREYLKRAGIWMPVLYVVLQCLQVVILPIPGIVSTAAGVALFGAFWTSIYSLIGILVGSLIAFFIGRKLGYKAVSWLVGEETLEKWQQKLKGKDNFFLTAMFALPFFPDDILCFVAGLSSMTTRYFLVMISITRLVGIFATCYSVNFIPLNTWWGLLLWGAFFVSIIVVFLVLQKNMDKIHQAIKKKRAKKH